jgi:hypothetical protein
VARFAVAHTWPAPHITTNTTMISSSVRMAGPAAVHRFSFAATMAPSDRRSHGEALHENGVTVSLAEDVGRSTAIDGPASGAGVRPSEAERQSC